MQPARPIRGHRTVLDGLAERVLRRGGASENDRARVALALIVEQRNQTRRLAYRHRQHAGGLRIERSEVSDTGFAIAPAPAVDAA